MLDLIELIKVIVLGIVEGITEWLPISSTGHMLLVDAFMQLDATEAFKDMFFYVIQLGAILAVIVIFWKKMFPIHKEEGKLTIHIPTILTWCKVVVCCIPGTVVALLFDDWIDANLHTPLVIAVALVVYGIAFLVIDRKERTVRVHTLEDIRFSDAFLIGLFQMLSIIPGTSRSGATIVGALLIGVSRVASAEFTFFLAVPVMIGMSGLEILKFGFDFTAPEICTMLVGMTVAFLVSIVVVRFLMNYIRTHDFKVFGWYRIVLGVVVVLWSLLK